MIADTISASQQFFAEVDPVLVLRTGAIGLSILFGGAIGVGAILLHRRDRAGVDPMASEWGDIPGLTDEELQQLRERNPQPAGPALQPDAGDGRNAIPSTPAVVRDPFFVAVRGGRVIRLWDDVQ